MAHNSPDPTLAPLVGGRYELTGLIASGGMGEVYAARDTVLDRRVALKILHSHLAQDGDFVERFRREATNAARLTHPNIVAVYDWGESAYMVLEYVDGQNLRQMMSTRGRLPSRTAAGIALGVCAALDTARRAGIVHRDIKPENILVTRDGVVKVADFGVARALAESRVTQPDQVMGTAAYLAPEQVENATTGHRADLYALGTVMFEMVSGRVPFEGDTPVAVALRRTKEDVPDVGTIAPDVSPGLAEVIERATRRRPEDRFTTAAEMAEAIRSAVPDAGTGDLADIAQPTVAIPIATADTLPVGLKQPQRAAKRRRRRWIPLLIGLLVLAVGVPAGLKATQKITVPSVVNAPRELAEAALKKAGLGEVTEITANHPSIPPGRVISQDPAANRRVRRGTPTKLVISSGPELVTVPDVTNKTEAEAKKILEAKGLKFTVSSVYSGTVKKGLVISQRPEAPSVLAKGSPVTITVSKGPEQVTVPTVTNNPLQAARDALEAAGFTVVVQNADSETVEAGRVISTTPAGGTKADKGSRVTVVVSNGPTQFSMPDVRGMSYSEAKAQLEGMGLKVARRQVPGSYGDTVVSSVPSAGKKVRKGQTVILYTA